MKTRQEKIDFIYEKIARKELKFWCKLQVRKRISWWKLTFEKWFEFILVFSRENQNVVYVNEKFWYTLTFANSEFEDLKVIWLPVMIGDVLEWIENNLNNWYVKCCKCWADMIYEDFYYCSNEECENDDEPEDFVFLNKWDLVIENAWRDTRFINKDNFLWKKLNKPIEEQSDECIDFVYSLLEKKDKTFT